MSGLVSVGDAGRPRRARRPGPGRPGPGHRRPEGPAWPSRPGVACRPIAAARTSRAPCRFEKRGQERLEVAAWRRPAGPGSRRPAAAAPSTSSLARRRPPAAGCPPAGPAAASASICERPAWPPIAARASSASARRRLVRPRATPASSPRAPRPPPRASRGPPAGSPTVSHGSLRSDARGLDERTSLSRSCAGRSLRLAAASARASSALTRIGAAKPVGSDRLLIDESQVGGRPALADHLHDRALARFGHAPALEQLHHRAVGLGRVIAFAGVAR